MSHITFIHGIANKPEPDALLTLWQRCLAHDDGLDLGAEGVTSSMVYWADVMYEKPEADEASFESAEENAAGVEATPVDTSWRGQLRGEEKETIDALAAKLGMDKPGDDDYAPPESDIGIEFERIPLPWWLKRRLMEILVRDVHHYLFNAESSPRPGVTYRVQDEIRARMLKALKEGAAKPGPLIVVSHSMGTVIAYDCLKRVPGCPKVDGLMTIGSPLGLDEVQDKLQPEWSRINGFPSDRVSGRWVNVYDKLDPVAGLDPNFVNDYLKNGLPAVEDVNEQNSGKWRHNVTKYLSGKQLRAKLGEMLKL